MSVRHNSCRRWDHTNRHVLFPFLYIYHCKIDIHVILVFKYRKTCGMCQWVFQSLEMNSWIRNVHQWHFKVFVSAYQMKSHSLYKMKITMTQNSGFGDFFNFFYEPNLLDTVFQRSNITQVPLAWMNYYHLIRSFFFLCLSISQVGAKFHFLLFCFRKRCHSVEFANNVRLDLFQHIHMHF